MSRLRYNNIDLQVLKVNSLQREPVFSGQEYLYTRFVLSARAVYNPNQNGPGSPPASYVQVQRGDPISVGGSDAPATDIAIRHALLQPRKTLLYTVGAHEVIRSPSLRDPFNPANGSRDVDSAGGPKPLSCHVVQIGGIKTFLVDYSVETHINEAPRYVQTPSYILSNVWKDSRQLSQDFYETRVVEGRAVFRRDKLETLFLRPDDFRKFLFHPIAPGYKRENVVVVAEEDGNTLSYSFEDREKAVTLLTTNITRVEATHALEVSKCLSDKGASTRFPITELGLVILGAQAIEH